MSTSQSKGIFKRRALHTTPQPKDASQTVPEQPEAPLKTGQHLVNTRGLSCLAEELYLEIISHLPAFPLPSQHDREDIEQYGDRRLVLIALSQTCQSLRRVFLRYRSRHIEVYERMDLGNGPLPALTPKAHSSILKKYSREVLKQLETVTSGEPAFADMVNVLDVVIVNHGTRSVLSELARCISIMPNLHTIQIDIRIKDEAKRTPEFFSGYTYPQIRNAYVSCASSIPFCCPALKAFNFNCSFDWQLYATSNQVLPFRSSLETIGPITVPQSSTLQTFTLNSYIVELAKFENLRDITFKLDILPNDTDMMALWKIAPLKCLRIIFPSMLRWSSKYNINEWKVRMEQLSGTPGLFLGRRKQLLLYYSVGRHDWI